VEAVRDDADGPGRVTKRELGPGDREVQGEDAEKDAEDRAVSGFQVVAFGYQLPAISSLPSPLSITTN
jgi:hypothetical protein